MRQRKDRPILGIKRPIESAQPASIEHPQTTPNEAKNQPELTPAERFEAALWNARNEWSIGRHTLPTDAEGWVRGGGFAGMGKINKGQADKLWTRYKAALAGAGAR